MIKVVCISSLFENMEHQVYNAKLNITLPPQTDTYYSIYKDDKLLGNYSANMFITLAEYRQQQIEMLLND